LGQEKLVGEFLSSALEADSNRSWAFIYLRLNDRVTTREKAQPTYKTV